MYSVIGRSLIKTIIASADPLAVSSYGLDACAGAVIVVFPYDPRAKASYAPLDTGLETGAGGPPPYARIGAFAAWNRYAALSRILKKAARIIADASGLEPRDFRVVVNSRLPEKLMAQAAGLGFIGRSSLLVSHAYGPACLIAALLLPEEYPLDADAGMSGKAMSHTSRTRGASEDFLECGTCRACLEACPTGAIGLCKGIELERCIQYWTTKPGHLPPSLIAAWGDRLYGCDICVASCPHSARAYEPDSRGKSPAAMADEIIIESERRPGPFVSAPFVSTAIDSELRSFFRKTALGLSWVGLPELRRNASYSLSARQPRPDI